MSDLKANLKQLKQFESSLERAKRKVVAVGLPKEAVGSKVYGDGMSIISIGAIHEYGLGAAPARSFLRLPFNVKKDELDSFMAKQFESLFYGKSVDQALGLVGVKAVNIVQQAFASGGFGKWPDIQQQTKNAKNSSKILIDTATLKNNVTWVVR